MFHASPGRAPTKHLTRKQYFHSQNAEQWRTFRQAPSSADLAMNGANFDLGVRSVVYY